MVTPLCLVEHMKASCRGEILVRTMTLFIAHCDRRIELFLSLFLSSFALEPVRNIAAESTT